MVFYQYFAALLPIEVFIDGKDDLYEDQEMQFEKEFPEYELVKNEEGVWVSRAQIKSPDIRNDSNFKSLISLEMYVASNYQKRLQSVIGATTEIIQSMDKALSDK